MERLLRIIKKVTPAPLFRVLQPVYHYAMALLGALLYRFPSRSMFVIGVTGTKGKSTVTEILNAILEEDGKKTALANTIRFKIAGRTEPNLFKMTMPGRFFLQHFLRKAVNHKCEYALLEMTSEGVKQFRHKWIYLDALIFTNITPEHIEAHGSFEKYLRAKLALAKLLEHSPKKERAMVANVDDKHGDKFLAADVEHKIPYSLKDAEPYTLKERSSTITAGHTSLTAPLTGRFNVYNALAAVKLARHVGVGMETIQRAFSKLAPIPGRIEYIDCGQPFDVVVDYAHTPDSQKELYETFKEKEKICVLGNTGGGRDKWKRSIMGKIGENYCRHVILTNEDPYDEDPEAIVRDVAKDMKKKPEIIMDRRRAIRRALEIAHETLNPARSTERAGLDARNENVAVLITGKGTDPYIMGKDGTKTPWSDARVAREEILSLTGE